MDIQRYMSIYGNVYVFVIIPVHAYMYTGIEILVHIYFHLDKARNIYLY